MRTAQQFLDRWRDDGRLTAAQHDAIAAVVSRRRISLVVELNALLYLGVLAFAGGLAWTARTYSDQWGDLAILLPATALMAGCFAWVWRQAPPYSHERVASASLVVEYVLYLGCLVLGVELGYAQARFPALQAHWDSLLLASALVYVAAAYRFDNRLVLSLGIATLGGWFGVQLSRMPWFANDGARVMTLLYGLLVAALGAGTWQLGLRRHFLDAYLQIAAIVVLSTLTWSVLESDSISLWTVAALAAAAISVTGGVRHRRFSFVVYGAFAGYLSISRELLRGVPGISASFLYILVSATGMIVGLVVLSRRMGRRA